MQEVNPPDTRAGFTTDVSDASSSVPLPSIRTSARTAHAKAATEDRDRKPVLSTARATETAKAAMAANSTTSVQSEAAASDETVPDPADPASTESSNGGTAARTAAAVRRTR